MLGLCDYGNIPEHQCEGCPLAKSDGKPCPLVQLIDTRTALEWAVKTGMNNITETTDINSASVILFLRRVVLDGYSLRTLRPCSAEFIKERALIEIGSEAYQWPSC